MKSGFLFAQPGFLIGAGRLLDLCGLMDSYNNSDSEAEADARGLYSDFYITGEDLMRAAAQIEAEDKALNNELQIPLFGGV